ncbi:YhfG family protein [Corallococcus sp. ZKHCc1 1396]|uniref:YhfG family protein n=1 Tax=Corallococcus soli TaxID=2710757 RepID=A0ABR9PRM2_9BACT|nr:hypothetical protein [Corallococcus soli]MBE4750582.1 YhfG family protein [Corallococcus soli]
MASDAERQLEGRAELIAEALPLHAELERVLSGSGWRRRLLKRPELVPTLVSRTEALKEALERVQHRAASESWSGSLPVLRQARKLSELRERLPGLARRRLEALAVAPADLPLEEALTRLDALVRQPVSQALNPGEVLVFEADSRWHPGRRLMQGFIPHPERGSSRGPSFMATLMGGTLRPLWWLARPLLGSGRVRITSERLLWIPAIGEPQAVRLGTIPDGGITVDPFTLDLRVTGDRRLHARAVLDAFEVASLLELHRQPPLRGAARSGVRLKQVAILPASLQGPDEEWLRGHCVLRPGGVSFIPEHQGQRSLQAITGKDSSLEGFDADGVLESLRWLPQEEFDACVARVVNATGGTFWEARRTHHVPQTSASKWRSVLIECGKSALRGRLDWTQQADVEALLRDWPRK